MKIMFNEDFNLNIDLPTMLAIDMPMPKGCSECPFEIQDECAIYEGQEDGITAGYESNEKPAWCPIIEIKLESRDNDYDNWISRAEANIDSDCVYHYEGNGKDECILGHKRCCSYGFKDVNCREYKSTIF